MTFQPYCEYTVRQHVTQGHREVKENDPERITFKRGETIPEKFVDKLVPHDKDVHDVADQIDFESFDDNMRPPMMCVCVCVVLRDHLCGASCARARCE